MDGSRRYPKIGIRSKNELAKRISGKGLSQQQALDLINDVVKNRDKYWKDSKMSEPLSEKWVRNASHTNYGKLLSLISTRVLAPHDNMVPDFIFGGLKERSCKSAAKNLLGTNRKRMLLKLDLKRFYEQNKYERVYSLFLHKCDCGEKGAKLLADLCCVPFGSKTEPQDYQTIARGFSTSPRLAVLCNLDLFIKLNSTVKQSMRGKDPKISIYVDDIGVTASRATIEDMQRLYGKLSAVVTGDKHHPLIVNEKKTRIVKHSGDTYGINGELLGKWSFEFVGNQMKRNSLTIGSKTNRKLRNIRQSKQHTKNKRSLLAYKNYVEKK